VKPHASSTAPNQSGAAPGSTRGWPNSASGRRPMTQVARG
jgi:hypothetical protein